MKVKLQIIGPNLGWEQLGKIIEIPDFFIAREKLEIILDGYYFVAERVFFNADEGEVLIRVGEPNFGKLTIEKALSLGWEKGRKE